MKTIITKEDKTTPRIILNHINGTLKITGKSIPFQPELFWVSVINQIKGYDIKIIEVDLEYINSNSVPYLIELINFKGINVVWVYDDFDEDMYDLGKSLKSLSNNFFEFVSLENREHVFVC